MSRFLVPILLSTWALASCQPRAGGPAAATEAPSGGLAPDTEVARIDGKAITAREVDQRIHSAIVHADIEHLEKVHDLRAQALEELINERLIDKQAKADGVTSQALLAREIDANVPEPTDDELRGLYKQATDAGQQLPPFDDIREQIVKYLKDQKRGEKLDEYQKTLRSKTTVVTMLPAPVLPRIEVDATGPARGEAKAPITIIEFSDYECPFCHRAEPTVKEVMDSYRGKVRLVYREFPLPGHPHAQKASEAAMCAEDQGKYWEMHDKLFSVEDLELASLKGYAKDLGMDPAKFDKCLDDGVKKDVVAASVKAGQDAGVNGTPAFFINGRMLSGALPVEKFKEVIDAELASAKL